MTTPNTPKVTSFAAPREKRTNSGGLFTHNLLFGLENGQPVATMREYIEIKGDVATPTGFGDAMVTINTIFRNRKNNGYHTDLTLTKEALVNLLQRIEASHAKGVRIGLQIDSIYEKAATAGVDAAELAAALAALKTALKAAKDE
jgi:2,4-dienoyl-CoA reductase-like NADH-dependent reductase (Old Yellow Enzyme family)